MTALHPMKGHERIAGKFARHSILKKVEGLGKGQPNDVKMRWDSPCREDISPRQRLSPAIYAKRRLL